MAGVPPVHARWRDKEVTFESAEAFRAELDTYLCKGALRMTGDGLPDPLTEFEFVLRAPGAGAGVSLRGMIVSTAGDVVLVQILGFDDAVISQITRATPAPDLAAPEIEHYEVRHHVSGVFVASAPRPVDGLSGRLHTPGALAELHTLPLGPVAGVTDLDRVSTIGLVRYLGAVRATGTLTITLESEPARDLPMQGGYFLLTKRDLESVPAWMFAADGVYSFAADTQSFRPAAKRLSPRQLVARGLRSRIRSADIGEVRQLVDPARAVRLTAAYAERAHSIGLSGRDQRLIERHFDGSRRIADIAHGGQTERKILRLVLMLQLMALVELVDVVDAAAGLDRDPVQELYERLAHSDLFAALDLHWTSSPRLLEPKLEEIRREYGPSSGSYATSPEFAAKRLELAERAYERLASVPARRAYRADVLKVDVEAAAQTMVQNVLVLKYRGDIKEAIERVHAALDLAPKKEYHDLLRTLELG